MRRLVRHLATLLILAAPQILTAEAPLDFDGDGVSDRTIYRNGVWWIDRSTAGITVGAFGIAGDTLVPADYNGDGQTDRAIWRNGTFWISFTGGGTSTGVWGAPGDDPRVVGDYDGDGDADLAIYRPGASPGQNGHYWIRRSSDSGVMVVTWGVNGDIPVPGNFSGFSRADYCVYRPSNNTFYVLDSQTAAFTTFVVGDSAVDRLVAMNRVGSANTDFAVFRNSGPDAGDWFSLSPNGASLYEPSFGLAGDLPLPFVTTNGGTSALAVVRDQAGSLRWYWRASPEGGISQTAFGVTGDIVPAHTFFVR